MTKNSGSGLILDTGGGSGVGGMHFIFCKKQNDAVFARIGANKRNAWPVGERGEPKRGSCGPTSAR